ncbi:hypothetical protein DPMN_084217 [Dreissena polymorpha]|uniref:Uncharacterized protein n=1 Tax=Dreissena polymorpha TaxID=45954 RepID=A0A9D4BBU4_DREPO|nr:hypothetical protein DPMN_084217 [Dreissena polymorpha]
MLRSHEHRPESVSLPSQEYLQEHPEKKVILKYTFSAFIGCQSSYQQLESEG